MSHFDKWIMAAAAILIMGGCSSSDRNAPPAFKPPARLASASGQVGLSTSGEVGLSTGPVIVPDAGQVDASAALAALGQSGVVAKLRDLGLQASSVAGVSSPTTMTVVAASDHQAAETVLSGAIVNDHAPVYVIQMTGGPFTARRHPPGVPAPQGNVLIVTVDAATYRVTDVGYVDAEPDLSKVGSVQVNLLAQ